MDFISREKGIFKNPNKKPLNELQLEFHIISKVRKSLTEGKWQNVKEMAYKNYDLRTEKIPALDERWIQKHHSYYMYQPYYSEVTQAENDLFLSKNILFLGNLKFLLQCNYHQFWNYMVFEPKVGEILKGFLANAVNWYEVKHLDGEFLNLYNEIYERVARIYLRLLTFKESDSEYIPDDVAIKLIQENKLITYPLIINFCLLYGKTAHGLANILNNIFFADKRRVIYKKELRRIFEHTLLVFDMVGGQICGFEENSVVIPIGIRPKPRKFDPYWVDEVVMYLLDTAASLNAFLSKCYCAVNIAMEMDIPRRLLLFYNVYPALYNTLKDRANLPFEWPQMKERIFEHIGVGRSEFVNVFHVFVTYLIDNIIQTLGDNEKQDIFLEEYLTLISDALENEYFIVDYHNTHKIDLQLQTISDFHPQIDHTRMNYILECLSTLPTIGEVLPLKDEIEQPKKDLLSFPEVLAVPGPSNKDLKKPPSATELYEITKFVLDTLPYLGDGFIVECLKSYNYNASEVISAILDENLPPHLGKLDRNMVYVPPEPEPEKPVLAYKGKKPSYRDANDLLDDKCDMQQVKDFVLKASITYDMYDDEYDDRFDNELNIPFYEGDEDKGKPVEKRFEGYELISDPSDSSSEEELVTKSKDGFCEDPAALRLKREAHYSNNKNNKRNDVVGKPKGQGQDTKVLQNRDKKNTHKSSRANHNRKGGAQWKRNKGMIPM